MRGLLGALGGVVLAVSLAAPALAQDGRGREGWRERDIHRFHEHDFDRWREGRWWHGRREGRLGWWWVAGGGWYFYPQPVYPYPDPYTPPVAAVPLPAAPPPQAAAYYWCERPRGYYPYVAACRTPWRAVPAY